MPATRQLKMGRAPVAPNGVTRRLTNPAEWKPEDAHEYSTKNHGGSWFAIGSPGQTNVGQNPDGRKVPGMNWGGYGKPGYKAEGFNVTAAQRYRELRRFAEEQYSDDPEVMTAVTVLEEEGRKQAGSGPVWFDTGIAKHSSRSDSRKAASAQIAKVPFALSQWIARVYKPR